MASPNIVTTLELNDPATLIALAEKVRPAAHFLYERYCICNPATDIFPTEDIHIEYQDKAGRKLAPLVHKGYKSSDRRGYYTDKLTAARTAEKRSLTVENYMRKGFGESLFGGKDGAQRALEMTRTDLTNLTDNTMRRWEAMAADLLCHNKYTLNYQKSDANGSDEDATPVEVSFIDTEEGNICSYTPDALWNTDGVKLLDDIVAMCRQLEDNGGSAQDLLVGSDVFAWILQNKQAQQLLDLRRVEMMQISPTVKGQGATLKGLINVDGYDLNIIEYREKYHNDSGVLTPFLPANKVIVTEPGVIRSLFAAVTQVEQNNPGTYTTYYKTMVPKYIGDYHNDTSELMMVSRPLLAPIMKGGWVAADVL